MFTPACQNMKTLKPDPFLFRKKMTALISVASGDYGDSGDYGGGGSVGGGQSLYADRRRLSNLEAELVPIVNMGSAFHF